MLISVRNYDVPELLATIGKYISSHKTSTKPFFCLNKTLYQHLTMALAVA